MTTTSEYSKAQSATEGRSVKQFTANEVWIAMMVFLVLGFVGGFLIARMSGRNSNGKRN